VAFDLTAAVKIVFGVAGAPAVKQAGQDMRTLGNEAQEMGTKATRGAAGLDRISDRAQEASRGLRSLYGTVIQVAAAIGAIQFARLGIQFNSFIETSRLGIASLIVAQTDLSDASGKPLQGMQALTAATVLAEDQMTKLRIAGLETAATTEQLADAFQQAVGAGLSAGLNLDQIRTLTIGITQAAGALGVPMHQISQEVRTILEGSIDINARVAKSLGISNDMVKSWREQGKLAEELQKRLTAFQVAGAEVAKTWSAVQSNMSEAITTFAGSVTSGMFEQLKASGQRALAGIFDLNEQSFISRDFQGLAELLTDIFDRVGATLGRGMEFVVEQARDLSRWLSENKETAGDLLEQVSSIGRQLLEVASAAGSIVVFMVRWVVESGAVNVALRGIALLIAGIQDGVKLIGAAFAAVGGAILEVLFKPLEAWMRVMGAAANFVKEGWGDSLIATADEGRSIYESAYASAAKVFEEFKTGQTAVARLRREWEQFDGAIAKTAKKTGGAAPSYRGRPGQPAEASRADQGIAEAIARLAAEAAANEFEEVFGKSAAIQRYFKAIAEIQPGGRFAGASGALKQQFASTATDRYRVDARDEQAKAEFDALKRATDEEDRLQSEVAELQSRRDQERLRDWNELQDDLLDKTRDNNIELIKDERTRAQAQLAVDADLYRARIELLAKSDGERETLTKRFNEWLVSEQALLAERFKPEWQKMVEAWSDTTRTMREAFDNFIVRGLEAGEEAFVEFARTGKVSVRNLVDTIIAETARAAYRQHLGQPAARGLQSLGSGIFDMMVPGMNFGTAAQYGTNIGSQQTAMLAAQEAGMGDGLGGIFSSIGSWLVGLFHGGGRADSPSAIRAVDPSIFASARRMHGGAGPQSMLRSGEVPAILNADEGVFTPEQMRALAPAGGGSPGTVINYSQTVNVMPGASRETANQAAMRVGGQTTEAMNRFVR
jgi:plasmid maintenance system antidote protein VapI